MEEASVSYEASEDIISPYDKHQRLVGPVRGSSRGNFNLTSPGGRGR
jgi:hypothetical protein